MKSPYTKSYRYPSRETDRQNPSRVIIATIKKELLAVVFAVKYFRPYLDRTKFNIITDHKPLLWLFS